MSFKLVIVESPAKCGKIAGYLGLGFKCMASFGHLREISGLSSIDRENNYKIKFDISAGKKRKQIVSLQDCAKRASEVIIATDDDREGEAIGWHLCMMLKLPVKTTKRIIFNEVTQTALRKAMDSPTVLNMDLVYAQQARQVIDMLVGYTISPILWKKISQNTEKGLSAGRCQTPALRIAYDNLQDVKENPGDIVYNTTGYFTSKSLQFQLNKTYDSADEIEQFLEESCGFNHLFDITSPKKVTKSPPLPFTTSSLQQQSSNELRYSPKETMRLCQTLYENGLITYMRTDSITYAESFLEESNKYILERWGDRYSNTKNVNTKKEKKGKKKKSDDDSPDMAQEAHEAIRPTNIRRIELDDEVGPKEKRMYKLIWRNTVESCMTEAQATSVTASLTAPQKAMYRNTIEKITFLGWMAVSHSKEELKSEFDYITKLKKGQVMAYEKLISKMSIKNQKQYLNEAKLVKELEDKGIGRPSTFSSLIDKIQQRGYVKNSDIAGKKIKCDDYELVGSEMTITESTRELGAQKNRLVIQPLGILVHDVLMSGFAPVFDYNYTKTMESSLDSVAKGNKKYTELCSECDSNIKELIGNIDVSGEESKSGHIKIDDNHTYLIGKYGPVVRVGQGKQAVFKKARDDIDIDKLKRGEYALEEVLAQENESKHLGKHEGENVWIKKGKFGWYMRWKDKNHSLQSIDDPSIITELKQVVHLLEAKKGTLRDLDANMSIRSGKFGNYIYYKKHGETKPQFLRIKDYQGDYLTDDVERVIEWIKAKYKIV